MKALVVEDIRCQIDLDRLRQMLHLEEGGEDSGSLGRLVDRAQAIGRPKALFGMAFVEKREGDSVFIEGVRFESRVLRVNLARAHRVFPFVATCGRELEDWVNSIQGFLERYWAETIAEMALALACQALDARLAELSPGPSSTMNPGSLADWPLQEQGPLFALLGNPRASVGVELTESFLMIPRKSVSGLRFPTEESFENCQLCPREACSGRRAPYDAGLYERKYGQGRGSQGPPWQAPAQ